MRTVALVPIKLNSQRLSNKNILPLAGRPLCWHILNTLTKVSQIDEVYVYCSDENIVQYIPSSVIFQKRSAELDKDYIKAFDLYRNFIREIDADIYVVAHTTAPYVKAESLENALLQVQTGKNDSAFSAERIQTFAWFQGNPINYNLCDVPRTQDMKPVWVETSGFYIFKKEIFTKHNRRIGFTPYIQEVSGIEALDIDEKEDYEMALIYAQDAFGKK